MNLFVSNTLYANASNVGTATIGLSSASAKPFAVAAPILSPVKEPGPQAQAMQSMLALSVSVRSRISAIMGRMVWLCVSL